jgi:hypothetical protein
VILSLRIHAKESACSILMVRKVYASRKGRLCRLHLTSREFWSFFQEI